MSIELVKEYLENLRLRYPYASKSEKSRMLDEFCRVANRNRKYVIRILRQKPRATKKAGRKTRYTQLCQYHLQKLWILMNQMCSKKMKVALAIWLPFYKAPECDERVRKLLLSMSPSTIDRILRPFKALYWRRKRTGTRPGTLPKTLIPIKSFDYNVDGPGTVEADTVAHCGDSLSGTFVWSLTFTDVYSGWTENRAVWGKGADNIVEAIKDIEEQLPFELKAFNSDNGSEFLNQHLIRYFSCHTDPTKRRLLLTRSRAYKKNDNCHVEQKNWTHVRDLFGYERFENKELIEVMNIIYKQYQSVLQNFFIPQLKLLHKTRVGSRYKRVYTAPQTPYQRIMECSKISDEKKEKLKNIYEKLNPLELKKEIEANMKQVVRLMKIEENNNQEEQAYAA